MPDDRTFLTKWSSVQAFFVNSFISIAGLLILFGIGLVVVDVCIRALGFKPPGFTIAIVEYILLYFVLLSSPYLVRSKGHVLTDVLVQKLSGAPRLWVEKLVYFICISVSIVFAVVGGLLFIEAIQLGYMDERSIDIPYWILYALFPPCFFLIALEFVRFLVGADSLFSKREKTDVV